MELARLGAQAQAMGMIADNIANVNTVGFKSSRVTFEEAFAQHGDSIACAIVEPVAGNMSCIPPAQGFLETSNIPRFYFDVGLEAKKQQTDTTAWTPAVSLIIGLRDVLRMIREEGLDKMMLVKPADIVFNWARLNSIWPMTVPHQDS